MGRPDSHPLCESCGTRSGVANDSTQSCGWATPTCAAYDRVPDGTSDALRGEEALGYLVKPHPDILLIRRLIARLRAFLFRTFGIGARRLSADDMVALAQASARRATRNQGPVNRASEAQAAYPRQETDTPALSAGSGPGNTPRNSVFAGEPVYLVVRRRVPRQRRAAVGGRE